MHAASERRGHEAYRLLRDDCGARVMRIIAVIERVAEASKEGWRDRPPYLQEDAIITARSVSPDGYGRFLIDSFEDWDATPPTGECPHPAQPPPHAGVGSDLVSDVVLLSFAAAVDPIYRSAAR